jgi:uncharacterized protein
VYWTRKAADQGNAGAEFNLGLAYMKGQGVPQDYVKAVYWYQMAADQGNAGAEFNLGLAYMNGQDVPQDYAEAYKWVELAKAASKSGDQVYEIASQKMTTLEARMTPEQIARAQAAASAWFAAHNQH